ncbi:unnamed protein product [Orchesella dallaii]|uniref:Uncharacterized protein n=1 Tax=Orchesella dallaii TaxID=48710 RepID=A0ABP1PWL9_9HEXA
MGDCRGSYNYTVKPIPMNDAWDISSNASFTDSTAQFSPLSVTSEKRRSSSSSSSFRSYSSFSSSTTSAGTSYYSNNSNITSVVGRELKNLEPKIFDKSLWYCQKCPQVGPYFLRQRPCSVAPRGMDFGPIGCVRKPPTFGLQRNSVCSESGFHTAAHRDLTGRSHESWSSNDAGATSPRSLISDHSGYRYRNS